MNTSTINQIVDECLRKLRNISDSNTQGLRSELRSLLIASFSKLNLVTRDDFEAQRLLLERTCNMVAELEEKVIRLEQQYEQAKSK